MMGGFGLLYLARGLAVNRLWCFPRGAMLESFVLNWHPEEPEEGNTATGAEYYAILDRIGRGEEP
jgi:hypothetical protein